MVKANYCQSNGGADCGSQAIASAQATIGLNLIGQAALFASGTRIVGAGIRTALVGAEAGFWGTALTNMGIGAVASDALYTGTRYYSGQGLPGLPDLIYPTLSGASGGWLWTVNRPLTVFLGASAQSLSWELNIPELQNYPNLSADKQQIAQANYWSNVLGTGLLGAGLTLKSPSGIAESGFGPDLTAKPLLLEGPQQPGGLLPKPDAQGVGATTVYGDAAGNLFVGKLPPEAGTQPIGMAPVTAEQLTAFRNVEIIDSSGKPVGELDRVKFDPAVPGNNVMIEDKSATGLQNPLNIQSDAQWAQKQIFDKTVVRVDAIENMGISTRPTPDGMGTPVVPTLSDLQTIKNYQFNIDYDKPAFQVEVNKQVQALNAMFSNWTFSANFGK